MGDYAIMSNLNVHEAFVEFHLGHLHKLDFIPNVKELRGDFIKAMKGTCCRSRRRVVVEQKKLFTEAFEAATQ